MKKKYLFIGAASLVSSISIVSSILFLIFCIPLITRVSSYLTKPAKPEIKNAIFEYRLEYRLNDEYNTSQGKLKGYFDGYMCSAGNYHWNWALKDYATKKSFEYAKLFDINANEYVAFEVAHADYLMTGECVHNPSYSNEEPSFYVYSNIKPRKYIDENDLSSKYNCDIISWTCSPPIIQKENTDK